MKKSYKDNRKLEFIRPFDNYLIQLIKFMGAGNKAQGGDSACPTLYTWFVLFGASTRSCPFCFLGQIYIYLQL